MRALHESTFHPYSDKRRAHTHVLYTRHVQDAEAQVKKLIVDGVVLVATVEGGKVIGSVAISAEVAPGAVPKDVEPHQLLPCAIVAGTTTTSRIAHMHFLAVSSLHRRVGIANDLAHTAMRTLHETHPTLQAVCNAHHTRSARGVMHLACAAATARLRRACTVHAL